MNMCVSRVRIDSYRAPIVVEISLTNRAPKVTLSTGSLLRAMRPKRAILDFDLYKKKRKKRPANILR